MGQMSMALGSTPKQRREKSKGGRPRKTPKGQSRHVRRERFAKLTPVHVTLKVNRAVKNLRRRSAYGAVRRALVTVAVRVDCRIVHLSLEHDHLHLVVEATGDGALAKGMQAFQIAAAQYLNRAVSKETKTKRTGQVFVDRYHVRILRSPTQTYRALNYVLNNWRKHGEHRNPSCANWEVDYFSSAPSFTGWSAPLDPSCTFDGGWPYEPLPVAPASHWFLTAGWRKAGTLSPSTIPG